MPTVQIHCTGRRYPNAPVRAIGGCWERPPPYYFFPFTGGFTGTWADKNAVFVPMRYAVQVPSGGLDTLARWLPDPELTLQRRMTVELYKPPMGVWTIDVVYLDPGFAPTPFTRFRRAFPNGFPPWPDFYQIDWHDSVAWTHNNPAIVNLYIGSYALCPVDLCLP